MSTFTSPDQYNDHLVNTLTKISLEDYFKAYHEQFYPDKDISFMSFFIEISAKKHEFCIPHTKLFEYGVMAECFSTDVLRRLTKLHLKNGVNYNTRKVSGMTKDKITYMLKPRAFKKALMRAGKNSKQPINVDIYAEYYLLLEDVYIDYTAYERAYSKKILETKDAKIDHLITLTTSQTNTISNQSNTIDRQSKKIDLLLKFAEETKDELHEVKLELVDIKAQLNKIISAVVSLAYLPNIYKRFYEKDHGSKKVRDGKAFSLTSVAKTKTLVFVCTYMPSTNQIKIECVNRKLNEPQIQVNKIITRADTHNEKEIEAYCHEHGLDNGHTDEVYDALADKFHSVLMPQSYGVSTLNEQEIRSNYSKLDSNVFESLGVTQFNWDTKYKAMIFNGIDSLESAQECFNQFIDTNQTNNIHSYDQSLEESIANSNEILSPEALDELKRRNNEFAYESKALIDGYYRKCYVCQVRKISTPPHHTYLRLRRNPKTTLDDLKGSIRELVIAGLDFN